MTQKSKIYSTWLALTAAVALFPVAFNVIVDAFNHNRLVDLDLDKAEVSVKAHYPLYKMIEYPRIKAPTVVLGDSRARALQDKYWRDVGRDDVYNFAYGGATVFEIYDTFKYLTETVELETLIVSLPLRSMDARFKGGMNRVPEAISLADNPFGYYTNWFVAKTGWQLLSERYPQTVARFDVSSITSMLVSLLVSRAEAAEFSSFETLSVEALLDPALCDECALSAPRGTLVLPTAYRGHGHGYGLGYWGRYWPEITVERDLPQLFAKQVGTNGAADWRRFKQSDELWAKVEEIAAWTKANDVELVFLIPPTIPEMQRRIADFGLTAANHKFRERLSQMAPVIDFDFESAFTRDLDNFTDAYHFGSTSARRIVAELALMLDGDVDHTAITQLRTADLSCPVSANEQVRSHRQGQLELIEGSSCRLWRALP